MLCLTPVAAPRSLKKFSVQTPGLLQCRLASDGISVEATPDGTSSVRVCRWQDAFEVRNGTDVADFIAIDRDRVFVSIPGLPAAAVGKNHMVYIDTGIDTTWLTLDAEGISEPFIIVSDADDDESYNGKAGLGKQRDNQLHDQTIAGSPGLHKSFDEAETPPSDITVTVALSDGSMLPPMKFGNVAKPVNDIKCEIFLLTENGVSDSAWDAAIDDVFKSARETWAQIGVSLTRVGSYKIFPIATPTEFWTAIASGTLAYDTPRTIDGQIQWFEGWLSSMTPASGKIRRVFMVPTHKIVNVPTSLGGALEAYGYASQPGRRAVVCVDSSNHPDFTFAHEIGHSVSLSHQESLDGGVGYTHYLMAAPSRITSGNYSDSKRFSKSDEKSVQDYLQSLNK